MVSKQAKLFRRADKGRAFYDLSKVKVQSHLSRCVPLSQRPLSAVESRDESAFHLTNVDLNIGSHRGSGPEPSSLRRRPWPHRDEAKVKQISLVGTASAPPDHDSTLQPEGVLIVVIAADRKCAVVAKARVKIFRLDGPERNSLAQLYVKPPAYCQGEGVLRVAASAKSREAITRAVL